jgi:fatty-acid peroxygenase
LRFGSADTPLDVSLALLRDPYRFIARRCREYGVDSFQARLMLRPTIFMTGPASARLFYDESRFTRRGAAPGPMVATLLGRGGVQNLDGEMHRRRKRMFLDLLTPERVQDLTGRTLAEWRAAARRWEGRSRVVLFDEAREVLARAVCGWAGVELDEAEVPQRTRQLSLMFDGAGARGFKHLRARRDRKLAEIWASNVIQAVRDGRLSPAPDTALFMVAHHRDANDQAMDLHTAAVELLNVLRPTVAVSVFVTFAAHALHLNPACGSCLDAEGETYAQCFVQEVRRFYPFFPAAVALVREDFEHEGRRYPKGRRVMLDLYGTDRDPRTWTAPEMFDPDRFRTREENPYDFIPQGGGKYASHHRCAGEPLTIELMKGALRFLREIRFEVPDQDHAIDFARIPALPRSKFVLADVRTGDFAAASVER